MTDFKSLLLPKDGLMVLIPALVAEFIGTMLFQLLGGISDPSFAYSGTFINGMTLMVLIYATASVSGGHLNPAVSLMAFALGKQSLIATAAYNAVQYTGAICGSALAAALIPSAMVGAGSGPGCFSPAGSVSSLQVFGWEAIMTGLLGFVVASTAMSRLGQGSHAPLAIGFTLFVSASGIGQFTGSFINPARVVGPVAVFQCSEQFEASTWIYILSEYSGALIGGLAYLATHKFRDLMAARKLDAGGLENKHAGCMEV